MKKAMKLVWMVLFALPMIGLTACGDEDEPDPFKQYDNLIDKTRSEVMKTVGAQISSEDLYGVYYDNLNEGNVKDLSVLFTLGEENNEGGLVTFDKAVWVDEYLYGTSYQAVLNFLTDKYGKSTMFTVEGDEEDGSDAETYLQFEKSGKYIWLFNDLSVTYVKKSEWDKIDTRSASKNVLKVKKMLRERR